MLQAKWTSYLTFFRLWKNRPYGHAPLPMAENRVAQFPEGNALLLAKSVLAADGKGVFDRDFLQKVLQVIRARFHDHRFRVAALARAVGLSQPQLFRKMKARTGQSAGELIRAFRLQQAKALLEGSDLNVSEIAYDCGFGSPAHFTHAFTDTFGLPPKVYREVFRK